MILKKILVIRKDTYYRIKIRMTFLENIWGRYILCNDCRSEPRFCRYNEMDCRRINFVLVKEKINYRYFPYAPEEKVYLTEDDNI